MLRNLPSSGGQQSETAANTAYALRGKAGDLRTLRYWMSLRRISLLEGERPTKATIRNWSERMISHTGTEHRSGHLRAAAVGSTGQGGQARSSQAAVVQTAAG